MCSLPNLRSALIAELRAGLELMLAIRALRGHLRSAAFVTELCACFQICPTFHALHSCRRSASGSFGYSRAALLHCIGHRARHGVAYRESSTESCAQARSAAGILGGIAHRLGGLELRVLAHVAEHAHLG